MKLGDYDVRSLASEARLSLTDDELGNAVRFINDFLDMADKFKELDLKSVEPFCFAEITVCPLREDNPEHFGQRTEILADRTNAGVGTDACFKVPRIMEE